MSAIVARLGRGVAVVRRRRTGTAAPGRAIPSSATPSSPRSRNRAAPPPRTGWQPRADRDRRRRTAARPRSLPAYVKSHSQGEYVFDHGWADAWERAGGDYYPKLQIAVPFTPVPGPAAAGAASRTLAPALIAAAEAVVSQHGLSSAHATFIAEEEVALFEQRRLADPRRQPVPLAQSRLWQLRGFPRRPVVAQAQGDPQGAGGGARGAGGRASHRRRDHRGALGRLLGLLPGHRRAQMGPALSDPRASSRCSASGWPTGSCSILALRDGRPIAGALNLIGADALYGRYWGATEEVPHLHFELCYYQAIEAAIARGLARVEAGAQGAHKLARGYRPVPTWSAHYHRRSGLPAGGRGFPASRARARWRARSARWPR